MPHREIYKVEWRDTFQQWAVVDGNGDILDLQDSHSAAMRRLPEIKAHDRWAMGIMGLLAKHTRGVRQGEWNQLNIASIFGVSSRTVRDAMTERGADS